VVGRGELRAFAAVVASICSSCLLEFPPVEDERDGGGATERDGGPIDRRDGGPDATMRDGGRDAGPRDAGGDDAGTSRDGGLLELLLQAETATLTPPAVVVTTTTAEGGRAVKMDDSVRHVGLCSPGPGVIHWTFDVPRDMTVRLFGRARADASGMDSLFVYIDGVCQTGLPNDYWDIDEGVGWVEERIGSFDLTAGPHQLELRQREHQIEVDYVIIRE
jgi:hypothetical protein